jgi:hypothetical protein
MHKRTFLTLAFVNITMFNSCSHKAPLKPAAENSKATNLEGVGKAFQGQLVLCSMAARKDVYDPFAPAEAQASQSENHDVWQEISRRPVNTTVFDQIVSKSAATCRTGVAAATGLETAVICLGADGVPMGGVIKMRNHPFYEIVDHFESTPRGYQTLPDATFIYVRDEQMATNLFTNWMDKSKQ